MAHSFHISQSKNTQVQINHYTCQTLITKEHKDRAKHISWCSTRTSYKYKYRVPSEGTSNTQTSHHYLA